MFFTLAKDVGLTYVIVFEITEVLGLLYFIILDRVRVQDIS